MILEQLIDTVFSRDPGRQAHRLMQAYHQYQRFSGAVLLARGGKILLRAGYGLANVEHNIAATPETVFRIGSMTKAFTALAVMQLADAGKLHVEDTLSKFLPAFPHADRIRLHHLLSNTSGIPDYLTLPLFQDRHREPVELDAIIGSFKDKALQYEPGRGFNYSNSNWVLLGSILEMLHAQPYAAIIQEKIFIPAGMTHSGFDWDVPIIKNRAQGYDNNGTTLTNAEPVTAAAMHGAGGLYSTTDDLYRFDRALRNATLVRQDTLRQMMQPISRMDTDDDLSYGCGWTIQQFHGHQGVGHSGGMYGFISNLVRFPAEDAVLIFLSNLSGTPYEDITQKLAAVLLGVPYEMPIAHTFITLDPAIYAAYVGDYRFGWGGRDWTARIQVEDDRLMMHILGWNQSVLHPLSATRFFTRSKGEVELNFVPGINGTADQIEIDWGGRAMTAARIDNQPEA